MSWSGTLGLVLGVGALAFGASLTFPFIALDDAKHIWQNPYVMTLSWDNLSYFWKNPYYGLYIPLTYNLWTFLASASQALGLRHEISGLGAALFHLTNVLIHLANIYLLASVLTHWLGRQRPDAGSGGLIAALPFALHPLQSEAVAWASGLKDTLSTLLSLIAVAGFFALLAPSAETSKKNRSTDLPWPIPRWIRAAPKVCLAAGAIGALLAKPSAVVLPVALAIFTVSFSPGQRKQSVRWLVPLLAIALYATYLAKSAQPDSRLEFVTTPLERVKIALFSLGFYVHKALWPWPLAPDYGLTPPLVLESGRWLVSGAVGAMMLLLSGLAWWRKWHLVAVGCGLMLIGLSPVLGLIPFEFQNLSTVADRYFYLWPAVGMGLLLLAAVESLARFAPQIARVAPLVLAAVWFVLTFWQTQLWASNERLFTHTARVNPRSYLALNNLGLQAIRRGELEAAERDLKAALDAKPDYLAAIANLGVVYFKRNDFPATIAHYQKYLGQLPPGGPGSPATFADMYFNLGAAQLNLHQSEPGRASLEMAVRINPDHVMARFHLGRLYAALGQKTLALEQLRAARRLDPNNGAISQELIRLEGNP